MPQGYVGYDNKARKVRKIFVGVNNKAREIMKAYVGINGLAEQVFPPILNIPYVSGEYTFNQSEQTADIRDINYQYVELTGDTKGTHAHTYTITASIKTRYKPYITWSDGTIEDKVLTWTIKPYILSPLQQTSAIYYTGYEKSCLTATWNFYPIMGEERYRYIRDRGSSQINVGTYTSELYMVPNIYNEYDYLFDGNLSSAIAEWRISKGIPTFDNNDVVNNMQIYAVTSIRESHSGLIMEPSISDAVVTVTSQTSGITITGFGKGDGPSAESNAYIWVTVNTGEHSKHGTVRFTLDATDNTYSCTKDITRDWETTWYQ